MASPGSGPCLSLVSSLNPFRLILLFISVTSHYFSSVCLYVLYPLYAIYTPFQLPIFISLTPLFSHYFWESFPTFQPSGESLVSCTTWSALVPRIPQCLPFPILAYCCPGEGLARTGWVGFLHHSIQSSSRSRWGLNFLFPALFVADFSLITYVSN